MENRRPTDREMYEEIVNVFTTGESSMDPQLMIEFAQGKIASIERKAERAKERAAEKRAAGDALRDEVAALLTNEFALTAEIAALVNEKLGDDPSTGKPYTVQKIGYRCRSLVEAGLAEDTDLVVANADGKKSTKKGYKLAD